ncbi:hypothetical protein HNR26_004768 [Rhizobium rosettiformans]|uniref:Uncharacterized protein n=1 Tax=Rhizobium rosettiformans TaxID=1368430 RepID=A0A7W8MEN3_9HYPH|nr:hypothetical protein [Rhizobium rosettiformans]MBB5278666.1 hypothetical protein [Rhizobium rosettiformans]
MAGNDPRGRWKEQSNQIYGMAGCYTSRNEAQNIARQLNLL